ncbi:hypothetical protein H257_09317 [Aphanomyces astaci]|uniref:Uncharacterized protein n=1 Tax=Aphanomyces astaci TaxID=112090 RepID=W4GCS1_APHAT|nr:hypothetical protein H257_09317 [Aphanomyces astaci]ETV76879.1 hypothetical protein H257_09317 [Aphanomyces astaci]|eukprot:XP_009833791.1 hypothetical protein H257_09317 [Aphanomyces astaci]
MLQRWSAVRFRCPDAPAEMLQRSRKPDDVASIDQDHRDLVKAYKDEPGIKAFMDAHCNKTNFNDGWNCIGRARFSQLRRFCSGMAFVLAKTTSVESDFSILK